MSSARLRSFCALAMLLSTTIASAADDLPARIDRLIEAKIAGESVAATTDDYEFCRRVYLDFTERTPTVTELQAFVADSSADKRERLIDSLSAGVEFPRRMTDLFNTMLMERRGENPEWLKFLRRAFEQNMPWDKIVGEILDPDGDDPAHRGAAFFYTKRLEKIGQQETDYPGLTRDVGRLFLGMDLQCAQCHNHLFIDEYKQVDFQGLFAVYQNTFIRADVKYPAVGENLMTAKIPFMSVFDKVPLEVGPRVPGRDEMQIPVYAKGEEYLVPPDKKTKRTGVPKFSPLELLAHELPTTDNRPFAANIANRLWFVMMGRGLVDPLDQYHAANLPSHPELLDLLAAEMVEHDFDLRWLVGQLARTATYQRSTVLPEGMSPPPADSYRVAIERRLSAEQLMWSALVASGEYERQLADPNHSLAEIESQLADVRQKFVRAFANPPKEPEVEFAPGLQAALFLLNDKQVFEWLDPKRGGLVDRLSQLDDAAVADAAYLAVLNRPVDDHERILIANYLFKNDEQRIAAIGRVAWSLLASTEFCLNH